MAHKERRLNAGPSDSGLLRWGESTHDDVDPKHESPVPFPFPNMVRGTEETINPIPARTNTPQRSETRNFAPSGLYNSAYVQSGAVTNPQ